MMGTLAAKSTAKLSGNAHADCDAMPTTVDSVGDAQGESIRPVNTHCAPKDPTTANTGPTPNAMLKARPRRGASTPLLITSHKNTSLVAFAPPAIAPYNTAA